MGGKHFFGTCACVVEGLYRRRIVTRDATVYWALWERARAGEQAGGPG